MQRMMRNRKVHKGGGGFEVSTALAAIAAVVVEGIGLAISGGDISEWYSESMSKN